MPNTPKKSWITQELSHEDGSREVRTTYSDGHTSYILYRSDSSTEEGELKDGKKDGFIVKYDKDENPMHVAYYKNGKKQIFVSALSNGLTKLLNFKKAQDEKDIQMLVDYKVKGLLILDELKKLLRKIPGFKPRKLTPGPENSEKTNSTPIIESQTNPEKESAKDFRSTLGAVCHRKQATNAQHSQHSAHQTTDIVHLAKLAGKGPQGHA